MEKSLLEKRREKRLIAYIKPKKGGEELLSLKYWRFWVWKTLSTWRYEDPSEPNLFGRPIYVRKVDANTFWDTIKQKREIRMPNEPGPTLEQLEALIADNPDDDGKAREAVGTENESSQSTTNSPSNGPDDEKIREKINATINAAETHWPDAGKRPGSKHMAGVMTKPANAAKLNPANLSAETIRQILAGRYRLMKRLDIKGLS